MAQLGRLVIRLTGLTAGLLASGVPASAQQGAVQISAAVQGVTGDPERLGGQHRVEPDFSVSWLQPGSRFGIFQMEVRGTRRGKNPQLGRAYFSMRDLKYRGVIWTVEGGDAYFSPGIGDYKFSNLFTPAVTFTGGSVTARTARSSVAFVGGRASAWRNIFGSDPQALGQSLALFQASHRPIPALDFTARASRIRTWTLKEFSYTIDASDQAGGGARLAVTSSLQLVADGSLVSYRRAGKAEREQDGSFMAGANWLHSRGWVQINASRFSPGDFPALNYPLQDREGLFAAGDYDLAPRLRASAGWEAFRSNLNPASSLVSSRPTPTSSGTREFGAFRVQVSSRSAVTMRAEQGERLSRPVGLGFVAESDTGSWGAEWQAAIGQANAFVRYARRENVERSNQDGSYSQHDASGQVFVNVSRKAQVFATTLLTRTASGGGGGSTYWQAGGGTQLQIPKHDLWLRAEGTLARNLDLLTGNHVPRESLNFGLNGQINRQTSIALNVNLDRAAGPAIVGTPWTTRSMLRVIRSVPTGSAYMANSAVFSAAASGRGTGTVSGSVFADWNANGVADPGESSLEGIPLRIGPSQSATSRDGQFAFLNVPVGLREVGLDTSALPIDFDPPAVTAVQIELLRGETKRVLFGLIPLGKIQGQVIRDANSNGRADPGEEPVDGAIVVLDGGARSEQVRKGRFRFDGVRSGEHLVKLLVESLPEGAVIAGDAEVRTVLARESLSSEIPFLVSIEKRPEIRRVFPPRGGAGMAPGAATRPERPPAGRPQPAALPSAPPIVAPAPAPVRPAPRPSASASERPSDEPKVAAAPANAAGSRPPAGQYAIQIAALSDPLRARDLVRKLRASGLTAYLVSPSAGDPDALFRVRVGPYRTRAAALRANVGLEKARGEKLWVIKEMSAMER
jgi:cell division septation protein DedD